jgi:hypothetical protein
MRLKPSCPVVTRRGRTQDRILVSGHEVEALMSRSYEEGKDTG